MDKAQAISRGMKVQSQPAISATQPRTTIWQGWRFEEVPEELVRG